MIFKRDIFGKGPVEIMPNLYAQEIDADRRIKEYQQEIRQKILDMYGMDKVPEEIENYIQAAAAERSIAAGASGAEAAAAAAEARGCCAETTRPAVETPREMQAATMVEGGETKKGGREEMREKTRKSLVCRRRSK